MKNFVKKTRTCIRESDEFGHGISLNFNQQGSSFNTAIGGLCSLLLRFIMLAFVIFKSVKMSSHQYDNYISSTQLLTPQEKEDVSYYDLLSANVGLLPILSMDIVNDDGVVKPGKF